MKPVRKWIDKKGGLVYSTTPQFAKELNKHLEIRRMMGEYRQSGRAERRNNGVAEATDELKNTNSCRSNDQHIIALALVSGARLLISTDKKLHADFTNLKLLKPQGKVYQNEGHKHLLKQARCKSAK